MKYFAMSLTLAAAAMSFAATGAFAATSYYINANDPNAVAACTSQGGVVQTDATRRKVCVIQQACAMVAMPYVVNPNDPNAAQTCAAACGTITMDGSGQRVCVRANTMREPPNNN